MLLAVVGSIFWYYDIKYSMPTPVPVNYRHVHSATLVKLPDGLEKCRGGLFIHFYNPACPCSRFNKALFKSLAVKYRTRVNFVVVVLSKEKYTKTQLQEMFDINVPVITDSGLAKSCGVYSTPQAVIVDQYHRLYFRGNYNTSRYCTNPETNFAELAINDFLESKQYPLFGVSATRAYGCSLPGCNK